jgi:hypothetical protein
MGNRWLVSIQDDPQFYMLNSADGDEDGVTMADIQEVSM